MKSNIIKPIRYLPTSKRTFKGYPIHLDLVFRKYFYFMINIHGAIKKRYVYF
jgi:hypothetical protein